jgi:hypothetical protein
MAWTTAPVELFVAYLERLLAAADQGVSGDCRSCGAPHSRGAAYCWKCGQPLMSQATSAALIEPLETSERGSGGGGSAGWRVGVRADGLRSPRAASGRERRQ